MAIFLFFPKGRHFLFLQILVFISVSLLKAQSPVKLTTPIRKNISYHSGEAYLQFKPDVVMVIVEVVKNMKNTESLQLVNNTLFSNEFTDLQRLKRNGNEDITESAPIVELKGDTVLFKKQFVITERKIANLYYLIFELHAMGYKNIVAIHYRSSEMPNAATEVKSKAIANALAECREGNKPDRVISSIHEDVFFMNDLNGNFSGSGNLRLSPYQYPLNPGYITLYSKVTIGVELIQKE